jgi:tRNA(Ile)-lysidine synthase
MSCHPSSAKPAMLTSLAVLSAILRTLREQALVDRGERVLVAVSGGPDSTALLHALVRLAPRLGIELEAATVNHGLRPEAAGEVALVVERCRALGIACEALAVDVRGARGPHVSWQDAARRVRLGALEAQAARRGCARIALGHTADDQAETVLFRIVRGTGVAGLAAVPYRRGAFVRPMLEVRRREVLRYLGKRRIPFIEDPSNADRRFTRARIRHEWIPFLERENPRLVEALLALAADARGASSAPGLSRRAGATVARLAAAGAGTRRVSVRGGQVEVSYGEIRWALPETPLTTSVTEISGPGRYGSGAAALEVNEGTVPGAPAADTAAFDLDRLPLPLRVRAPRPGDRMRPRGGRGSRKLSDLFIDAKIPRTRRSGLPLLEAADGTILFVPGLRPSEVGRPGPHTRRWLEVRAASGLPE